MDKLITHMGGHSTEQINYRISHGYGTVRCNKCYITFNTVSDLEEHRCAQTTSVINGLSPIPSTDSLESVLIHGQ
jgi:protein-arginine kinase activator protein McsA